MRILLVQTFIKLVFVHIFQVYICLKILKIIKQTKEYTDKGYNNKTSLWSAEWSNEMMKDGKVFGNSLWADRRCQKDNAPPKSAPACRPCDRKAGSG